MSFPAGYKTKELLQYDNTHSLICRKFNSTPSFDRLNVKNHLLQILFLTCEDVTHKKSYRQLRKKWLNMYFMRKCMNAMEIKICGCIPTALTLIEN